MRRTTVFLVLVAGFVLGPAAMADETEREALEKAYESVVESAIRLADLARTQVKAGDTKAAAETLGLLEDLLEVQDHLKRRLATVRPKPRPKPVPRAAARRPAALAPVPPAGARGWYGGRGGLRNLRSNGGSATSQKAVDLALEWLKRHQSADGRWDSDGFTGECRLNECGSPGKPGHDTGVTGLALMAFLGTGQTGQRGAYGETVKKALERVLHVQDPEGCFGPRETNHFVYGHAICTQAMAEAAALSGSPVWRESARRGVAFIERAQNPYLAWRYGVRPGDNDTSVTGWMVSALYAAKAAGIEVSSGAFDGAKAWIDKATEPEYGRVGYVSRGSSSARPQNLMDVFPADKTESITAVGIWCRVLLGEHPRKSEMIMKGVDLCLKCPPEWDDAAGTIDMYYWYYGTLALFQVGGDAWKAWNQAMKAAVIDHQRKEGCEKGSWDAAGPWGPDGGRVYSTALMALTLETYYRFPRLN